MGRPETDHGTRGEPALGDDLVEHGLRIGEQLGSLLANHVVLEDGRIVARQFPRLEERRPVDVLAQFGEIVVVENGEAGLVGLWRV